jgi:hypothetical protein
MVNVVCFLGQLVVVSEGKEFLAGEEMANILVIKINIKKSITVLL